MRTRGLLRSVALAAALISPAELAISAAAQPAGMAAEAQAILDAAYAPDQPGAAASSTTVGLPLPMQ